MAQLTKRFVESLKPREKEYAVWDALLPGFGVRVYPSGRRGYCAQYRGPDGRSQRMSIGLHGVVTPHQARQRAQEILSAVKLGGDPAADREAAREAPTLAELAERYLAEHAEPKTKPRSVVEVRKLLRLHLLPMLGRKKAAAITRGDAEKLHHRLRDHPFQANRTLGLLGALLEMAERWELRPAGSNPCRHVERFKEPRRERFLSDGEFARLGAALRKVETENPTRRFACQAVRLIALLGARRNEVLTARWSYVDWDRRELRLPDSKTGPKSIPLPAAALQILEEIQAQSNGSPWIIPGRTRDSHLKDVAKPWKEIREAAGIENLRIHDLRHSHASTGARAGLSLPMIGALLGQRLAATTERYTHFGDDPIRAASEVVGSRIAAALDGKPEAEVIELSARKGA